MTRIKVRRGPPPPLKKAEEKPQAHKGVGEVSVSIADEPFVSLVQAMIGEHIGDRLRNTSRNPFGETEVPFYPNTYRREHSSGIRVSATSDPLNREIRFIMHVPGMSSRYATISVEHMMSGDHIMEYVVREVSGRFLDSLREELETEIRAAMVAGGVPHV